MPALSIFLDGPEALVAARDTGLITLREVDEGDIDGWVRWYWDATETGARALRVHRAYLASLESALFGPLHKHGDHA